MDSRRGNKHAEMSRYNLLSPKAPYSDGYRDGPELAEVPDEGANERPGPHKAAAGSTLASRQCAVVRTEVRRRCRSIRCIPAKIEPRTA